MSIRRIVLTCALALLVSACNQQAAPGSAPTTPPSPGWVDLETEDDFDSEDLERQLDALEEEFDAAPDETSSDSQEPRRPAEPSATLIEQTTSAMAAQLALTVFVAAPFAAVAATRQE